jgi:hypothetical protein
MERIKSINWKFAVYWFAVMSIINIYFIPTFVDHEPITAKRIMIGLGVCLVTGLIMGMIAKKKIDQE